MESHPFPHITNQDGQTGELRYTPQKFTEFIYEAVDLYGEDPNSTLVGLDAATAGPWNHNISVKISEARENKPTTIEFRQHHATLDATEIKWWVMFLAYLVKHSYFLAQDGRELRDEGNLQDTTRSPDEYSFVANYENQTSILDVIGFPEEGKQHFARCREKHRNNPHDAERELDKWIIAVRAKSSRMSGLLTGRRFDEQVRKTDEYRAEVERLEKKYRVRYLTQRFKGLQDNPDLEWNSDPLVHRVDGWVVRTENVPDDGGI